MLRLRNLLAVWQVVVYNRRVHKGISPMPARKTRTRKSTAPKAVAPKAVQSVPVVEPTPTVLEKPDVTLLTNEQLWNDLQNRVKVHNYEFSMMVKDLKQIIDWTQEQVKQIRVSS